MDAVMAEHRARAEVYARAAGRCEITGRANPTDYSHRIPASALGQWRPANGLHLDHRVHMWLHGHPEIAYAGGWQVQRGYRVQEVPVWLFRAEWPGTGWYLLDDMPGDGGSHLAVWCDEQPVRPQLPFEDRIDYLTWRKNVDPINSAVRRAG